MGVVDSTVVIVGAGWLAGFALLLASYKIAGDIWWRRHSLRLHFAGWEKKIPGAFGEAILLGLGAFTLIWIDSFTPAWSMTDLIFGSRLASLTWFAILIGIIAIVVWYSCGVPKQAERLGETPEDCKCLARTYCVYGVYSTLLFFGGWVLMGTLISQFLFDFRSFSGLADEVVARAQGAAGLPGLEMLAEVEATYLDSIRTLNAAQDQMSPVFVFAASIFVFNFLIRATPIQDLFLANARLITHATTLAAIVIILLAGGVMYVSIYSTFIDNYVQALLSLRPALEGASWEVQARFSEIVFAVEEKRSLVGFVSEMSNEWGGLAAIFGIGQWVVEKLTAGDEKTKKKQAEAAEAAADAGGAA